MEPLKSKDGKGNEHVFDRDLLMRQKDVIEKIVRRERERILDELDSAFADYYKKGLTNTAANLKTNITKIINDE